MIINSPTYDVSFKNWEIKYRNLKKIRKTLEFSEITEEEKKILEDLVMELERGHLIGFTREIHAKKSADYINEEYGTDKRLEIKGKNISYLVAKLCESHTMNPFDINESNGFRYNELFDNYKINMIYLAYILRLADILDFDQDRTPKVIFKTINFTNEVSFKEWNKHLSVFGKNFTTEEVQYTCYCEKPEYEKSVRTFINWINLELSSCLMLILCEGNY
jgi:hypothetical protein